MRKQGLGGWFWIEATLSAVTVVAAVVTLLWRDWIELVFGVDPDQGSGEVEWALIGALLVVSAILTTVAARGWQRMVGAAANS